MPLFGLLLVFILIGTLPVEGLSQSSSDASATESLIPAYDHWTVFTAQHQIKKMERRSTGELIVLTSGGLYSYRPGGEARMFNRADGKYANEATTMELDEVDGVVWLSYADGTLSRFDLATYSFRHFDDIRRNDRFVSNRINALKWYQGVLFVATDFGLIQFNTDRYFVIDTYTTFGNLSTASPVRSIWIDSAYILLGTDFGLARGLLSDDLKVPANWDVFDGENGFVSRAVTVVAGFGSTIYATSERVNYVFDGQAWVQHTLFPEPVLGIDADVDGSWVVVSSTHVVRFDPTLNRVTPVYTLGDGNQLTDAVQHGSNVWLGTSNSGLGIASPGAEMPVYFVPNGPRVNLFERIAFTQRGELLVGTSPAPGQFDIGVYDTGFSILSEDDTWEHFFRSTNPFIGERGLNSFFSVTSAGDDYFIGTWGYGIARLDRSSNELELYNNQTAGLPGITPAPDFYVATGLAPDRSNARYVWAVSWSNTVNPLARFDRQTNEWQVYGIISQVGVGSLYRDVFVDTYGQKWISLMTNTMSGRGLLVAKNAEGGSGEFVRLTSNLEFGGLPNEKVNTVVQDRRGEVWIGTDRGMGRFLFPDRVIGGTALERRAQPLINEDTTAFDRVLLRDVRVTSMLVDANNQKWVGSDGDGVYLVEESGRRVVRHFTMSNSPLPSNTIRSMALDSKTGELYLISGNSLVRYSTLEREAVGTMESLRVFPNPYSYLRNSGDRIVIENLSDDATIHILTIDGRLVKRFQSRGGRVDWDGLDESGRQVATGVYFIVATGNTNDQVGRGKVVIIR